MPFIIANLSCVSLPAGVGGLFVALAVLFERLRAWIPAIICPRGEVIFGAGAATLPSKAALEMLDRK